MAAAGGSFIAARSGNGCQEEKREGSDQLIVMFIIIAVAASIAGLLYIFGKTTLLPNIQDKLTNLINDWFNHA